VGSNIVSLLKENGYLNIITKNRSDLDLLNQRDTERFFEQERPDNVICAAAKVGGILANQNFPVNFLYENLNIQNNIIHSSYKFNVRSLVFLGSACIYPKYAHQPIRESSLLTGNLEATNEAYAIAKIAGLKLCEAYFRQYNKSFISIMPNNLYGPNDNFSPASSHVIPALIQKFHNAKSNSEKTVQIWGSGKPLREFLHVNDLCRAILILMKDSNINKLLESNSYHINIGSGEEISVKDLALLIREVTGFSGQIYFDNSKPDGTPRKLLDSTIIKGLGWRPKITLKEGIKNLYSWYINNL
tara:strand:+ start:4046 stop:4948 length:903 start_codon:yes stop_codon:yes gene_type:complete